LKFRVSDFAADRPEVIRSAEFIGIIGCFMWVPFKVILGGAFD